MKKRIYVSGVALILLVLIGALFYTLHAGKTSTNTKDLAVSSSVRNATDTKSIKTASDGEAVTVSGVIECLTPTNTTGPQPASCAIGMQADNGQNYAITSQDPSLVGSLSTGQRVQVSGQESKPQTAQYNIKGTIRVTSIEKL